MAKLTSKERNALPSSGFALPSQRKFPINDPSHAANAKARASQMANEGRISKATEERIDHRADAKLLGHANVRNPKSHADKLKHI